MAAPPPKPIFCVVLSDGDRWSVEAEWPDGTIEHVDSFKVHAEARRWVSTLSMAWLEARFTNRQLQTP